MKTQGCDCSIVIKTNHHEFDVPYSEETIREAVSVLQEEASIEEDGQCKAIIKKCGVTGCVVTPLTINTVPLLLYLAFGSVGKPVFISETRNLYRYHLDLLPMENSDCFDLIQDRGIDKLLFEQCRVQGFELRFECGQNIKLKLDLCGKKAACLYINNEKAEKANGEIFNSDNVRYKINERDYSNIYGLTILSKKESGTKTEIWIKRNINKDLELPNTIENIIITAALLRDKYEQNQYGIFRITLNNLVMVSDETSVNSSDTVIGPIRYYVSGVVYTEVFSNTDLYAAGEKNEIL